MGFYLIGPLVTLIPLGSISSWATKPYCDDGLLGISPTNDDIGKIFQTKKGLRQGDPLSPLLFNLVADMLTVMIARAKQD